MRLARNAKRDFVLIHGDQQMILKPSELTIAYRLIRDGVVMINAKND